MDLDFETIQIIQEEFQNDFVLPQKENIPDSILARQLQEQFQKELLSKNSSRNETSDFLLARSLQEQFKHIQSPNTSYGDLVYDKKSQNRESTRSLIDPSWEVIDPTPDIHVLFMAFNNKFFWGKLDSVCVSWSKRMKRCAGICSYQGRGGLCHITLSEPLLKLRPRKDLIETLLHEMIHALLFVTHNNKDRDGHGPEFHKHMYRINKEAGTKITVYHDFHDEVELYLQHWWRCDGPCQKWKPFFGIVRRSMNRAPGPHDRWWGQHSRSCGGTFIKIKSPEPKVKETKQKKSQPTNKITKFITSSGTSRDSDNVLSESKRKNSKPETIVKPTTSNIRSINSHNVSKPNSGLSTSVTIPSKTNNIHGFSNSATKTFVKGGTKMNSNTIVINKKYPTISQEKKSETSTRDRENTGDTIDYSVVRNHWVNKFSNLPTSGNSKTVVPSKRKSFDSIPVAAKATKFGELSSQDSLDCDSVPCPVCNISYPIDELNRHLDICLSEPKNHCKECIICSKDINENEYQQHVNECLEKNFVDNTPKNQHDKNDGIIIIEEDTMDLNYVNCSICKNQISIEELEEHLKLCKNRTECPECGKKINSGNYDLHLADCLMKKFDEMDQNLNAPSDVANGSERAKNESNEEKISCLACGDLILKNNLYSHLDECMKEVFDKDEKKEDADDNDDKLCNCPFCLKLVTEVEMSDHIDICLKSVDGDCEAERNKTLFLSEID